MTNTTETRREEPTTKLLAFEWLDDQCQSYGMNIRPYRMGIGLVALRYMKDGDRVHTKAHPSLYEACAAAMNGEVSEGTHGNFSGASIDQLD